MVLTHSIPKMLDRVMLREYSCAGLQSHDVEKTAIPCNLVGRVGGAVNEDTDIYGVIWVGQVELHSCTAHWDVSGAQFSRESSDVGRD